MTLLRFAGDGGCALRVRAYRRRLSGDCIQSGVPLAAPTSITHRSHGSSSCPSLLSAIVVARVCILPLISSSKPDGVTVALTQFDPMTAVSPVDRAPMEILLRIFSCLVPSPQYCWEQMARTYQDQVNVPMIIETIRNVRAVCSTWRNLVYFQRSMAVPLVIDLDDKGQPKQPLRPILQLVQMQETLPLVAAVLASPHSSTPMTTLAIAHALRLANNFSHRLTHFIIRLDGLHQSPFPAIYAPQLTHLLIRRDNCPTSYNYGCAGADRQHALEFIRAIDAPQLQVLALLTRLLMHQPPEPSGETDASSA